MESCCVFACPETHWCKLPSGMWLTESSLFLAGNGNAVIKPNLQLSLRGAVREVSDGGPLRGRSGGGGRRGQALESAQTSTSCHLVAHAASQHPLSAALLAPLPGYSAPWASLPAWTVNCMSQSVMSASLSPSAFSCTLPSPSIGCFHASLPCVVVFVLALVLALAHCPPSVHLHLPILPLEHLDTPGPILTPLPALSGQTLDPGRSGPSPPGLAQRPCLSTTLA